MSEQHNALHYANQASPLFLQRRYVEAAELFLKAHQAEPDNADYLCNMAACAVELEQWQDALQAANQALILNPAHAAAFANRADAWRNLGDLRAASEDYRQALALDGRNPVLLNKAGACLYLVDQHEAARRCYETALKLAPGFALARLNLGLLAVAMQRPLHAQQHIRQALRDGPLDSQSHHLGTVALAILAEQQRIEPLIRQALDQGRFEPLRNLETGTASILLEPDQAMLRAMQDLAASCNALDVPDQAFQYPGDTTHLAFLEAIGNSRVPWKDLKAPAALLARLENSQEIDLGASRNVLDLYRAIKARKRQAATADEHWRDSACLRFWHAQLTASQADALPGQYKAAPNAIGFKQLAPACAPEHTLMTVNRALGQIMPGIRPGVPRSLFLLSLVIEIHAFQDGNGRLARFACNALMESFGHQGIVILAEERDCYVQGLNKSRAAGDIRHLMDALLECHEYSQTVLNQFNRTLAAAL